MEPILVIVGETASGKSDLAFKLAQELNGEIICADSWTVRRQMDIGTAKPSAEEQAAVKHHLLDAVDPEQPYSAAVFKKQALDAIHDIQNRGKLPIMVGGTGLYIDGVIFDYNFLPAGPPGQREALEQLTREELLDKIKEQNIDLGNTDTRNKRRLMRLLETNGAQQTKGQLQKGTIIIGLLPEREQLKERITKRVDHMLEQGLEQEVQKLAQKYGWEAEGLKGIGYREWQDYFNGSQNLKTTRQRIISSTVHLSKRQRTWFKRHAQIKWFSTPVNYAQVVDYVTTELNTLG
ncbi:MAG TPA: tRNA (adenosine(37)-N6)-dimethylallyltransferase MiaA [Candidatus Saccharibacteria bacterium]|nr:tRNA (adenosine(37)-N6)-dimethylallyltransferase MiaA [Candidatus Saccharibacteria bacterium]